MEKTEQRNGVLIFVAPRAQKFAVFGDEGVHKKCGAECWRRIVDSSAQQLPGRKFQPRRCIGAIRQVGELLAKNFPKKGGGPNELPDEIVEGLNGAAIGACKIGRS